MERVKKGGLRQLVRRFAPQNGLTRRWLRNAFFLIVVFLLALQLLFTVMLGLYYYQSAENALSSRAQLHQRTMEVYWGTDTLLDEEKKNQKVVASVRPEEFVINRTGVGIPATVVSSTFLGLNMHYFLTLDSGEQVQVIQEAELDSCLQDGEKIRLHVKQGKINVFCEDGSRNLVRGVTNDNVRKQEA